MLIDDLATRPAITCEPETTIRDVAALMARAGVGSVVVVDDAGGAVGICTDRDLVVRALAHSWPAETPVHCAMTASVATVAAGTDASEALAAMHRHGVRRVPVVDGAGRVTGVVSLDDVMAAVADDLGAAVRGRANR
jgi:signal-transduction protein with cAMP-binding, CBS, and nucleotidyltransferase domain